MINYCKKNINIISFFISVFIFISIICILKVLSHNYKTSNNENQSKQQNIIDNNITENTSNNEVDIKDIYKWKISIEKLNLDTEIKEGTDDTIIKENVGHYTTSNIEHGNIALKAYNTGENKKYFANLKELEIGDEIIYTVNDKEYTYKVTSNIIIDNENLYTSKDNKNNLILITYIKDMKDKMRCVISELKN